MTGTRAPAARQPRSRREHRCQPARPYCRVCCSIRTAPQRQTLSRSLIPASRSPGAPPLVTLFLEPTVTPLFEDEDGAATMATAASILSPAECAAWIDWGEATGFQLEKHAQTAYIAHRDNGRLAVQSDVVAKAIFDRLMQAGLVPSTVGRLRPSGCNANIRLYKYGQGQRFGRHVDQSNRLSDGSSTEFTVLLYLNEGFRGGETVFYTSHFAATEAYRFSPSAGAVLVHAHGERCLTHVGSEVTQGVKYLLRTDLAYSR